MCGDEPRGYQYYRSPSLINPTCVGMNRGTKTVSNKSYH